MINFSCPLPLNVCNIALKVITDLSVLLLTNHVRALKAHFFSPFSLANGAIYPLAKLLDTTFPNAT